MHRFESCQGRKVARRGRCLVVTSDLDPVALFKFFGREPLGFSCEEDLSKA